MNVYAAEEFRPDSDHVTQVAKFEQTLIGKKPILVAPHRRLVCYCRLYEIYDLSKRERLTAHQREVFLFNDLLIVSFHSLIVSYKNLFFFGKFRLQKFPVKNVNKLQYQFRQAFRLSGMNLYLFETTRKETKICHSLLSNEISKKKFFLRLSIWYSSCT